MKKFIIFGGSSGIGEKVAEDLLIKGYSVLVFDRIKPSSDKVDFVELDLSNPESIAPLIQKRISNHVFDGLIYCAGIREICSLDELSYAEWKKVFNVNVDSFFLAVKTCRHNLIKKSSIVNISSVSGVLGEPNRSAYVSSKHALIGLTKCLAIELSPLEIRVNSVAPGVIKTPLTNDYYQDHVLMEKVNNNHIMKRTGEVGEVSEAIQFLLSSRSSFITGSTLFVDGGWTAFKDI
ncbi:SDR family NAD(P)-dependent oxidoreductase [Pectobacterium sp. A5351]|uniref:SDR family NAD(P)-dependent oxidoreductase n=1 Tax=Pectobacterium sp. A5351 TaxID=2914983 RepID=UPI00232CF7AF|nr:SDR family oxidoreductase [Pectobacterium sp. A5351]WCG82296.1 SDR family oxidoreductase [Pectobacterium sp. A5351]